jgi:uncharacterized protein
MNEAGLVGLVAHYGPYPVKSMMGEHIETVVVTERGILGDHIYALVDQSSGKLGNVKNPRQMGPPVKLVQCCGLGLEACSY